MFFRTCAAPSGLLNDIWRLPTAHAVGYVVPSLTGLLGIHDCGLGYARLPNCLGFMIADLPGTHACQTAWDSRLRICLGHTLTKRPGIHALAGCSLPVSSLARLSGNPRLRQPS